MRVDEKRLQEIEARIKAATAPPWERDTVHGTGDVITPSGDLLAADCRDEDADLIAHGRQDLPDLLTDLREARSRIPVGHPFEDLGAVRVTTGDCKPEVIDLSKPGGEARLAGALRVAAALHLPVTLTWVHDQGGAER